MVRGALDGVRIVEFGQLIAIPFATKLLADMGAEVIRIESCTRVELYRASGFYDNDASGEYWNRAVNFYEQNRNKQSLTLDLTKPEGRSALLELVSVSDVFAENFTPRVIGNFGLEYEDLRKVRPDIIMVSSTGYGHTGPWSGFGAIGFGTEAASGLSSVTGYRGRTSGDPRNPVLGLHRRGAYGVRDHGGARSQGGDRSGPVHRHLADADAQRDRTGSAHGLRLQRQDAGSIR